MARCWADSLGDCNDQQSREHVVSRGLFNSPDIEVSGFPWCKESKRIGLNALTSKILCSKHNNALSPLDQAAIDVFDAFREQSRVANAFPRGSIPTAFSRSAIDALRVERWLLKTLVNLAYGNALFISHDGVSPGEPTKELVEIVFGLRKFSGRAGMYVAAKPGITLKSQDTVEFGPLIKDDERILGGLFILRGFHLVLCLTPEGVGVGGFTFNKTLGPPWSGMALNRPFDRVDYTPIPQFVAHQIVFDWRASRPASR